MPYVKLVRGVVDHFPSRASEWIMSGVLITWGIILLGPNNVFASSPAWAEMSYVATENTWGLFAVSIGMMRLLALFINGTFPRTWYGKISPKVRAFMSALSVLVLVSISIGLYSATGLETTGLAVYPWLAVLDFWNVLRASSDAGQMDEGRKNGIP